MPTQTHRPRSLGSAKKSLADVYWSHELVDDSTRRLIREQSLYAHKVENLQDAKLRLESLSRLKVYTTRIQELYEQRVGEHESDEQHTGRLQTQTRLLCGLYVVTLVGKVVELVAPFCGVAKAAVDVATNAGHMGLLAKDAAGLAKDQYEAMAGGKNKSAYAKGSDAATITGKALSFRAKQAAFESRRTPQSMHGLNHVTSHVSDESRKMGLQAGKIAAMASLWEDFNKLIASAAEFNKAETHEDSASTTKWIAKVGECGFKLAKDLVELVQAMRELKGNSALKEVFDKSILKVGGIATALAILQDAVSIFQEWRQLDHLTKVKDAHKKLSEQLRGSERYQLAEDVTAVPKQSYSIPKNKKQYSSSDRASMRQMAGYAKVVGKIHGLRHLVSINDVIDRKMKVLRSTMKTSAKWEQKQVDYYRKKLRDNLEPLLGHLRALDREIEKLELADDLNRSEQELLATMHRERKMASRQVNLSLGLASGKYALR